MLKIGTPNCPTCKEQARGVVEQVSGISGLAFDNDGSADWVGGIALEWDTQTPKRDEENRVTLFCPNNHKWQSTMEEK